MEGGGGGGGGGGGSKAKASSISLANAMSNTRELCAVCAEKAQRFLPRILPLSSPAGSSAVNDDREEKEEKEDREEGGGNPPSRQAASSTSHVNSYSKYASSMCLMPSSLSPLFLPPPDPPPPFLPKHADSSTARTKPNAIISSPNRVASPLDETYPLLCIHDTASPPMKQEGRMVLVFGFLRLRI